jgi:hypothetical protein
MVKIEEDFRKLVSILKRFEEDYRAQVKLNHLKALHNTEDNRERVDLRLNMSHLKG